MGADLLLLREEVEVACFRIEAEGSGAEETKEELRRSFPSLVVQLADARVGFNERFFRMIAAQTISAMRYDSLLAKKPEVDLLLRLAGTTQISEALTRVGYRKGGMQVLIAAGQKDDIKKLLASGMVKGSRLASAELTKDERKRVEEAAVLSARRG